jgi:hypothetical protein
MNPESSPPVCRLAGHFDPAFRPPITFLKKQATDPVGPSNHTLDTPHRIKGWIVFDWKSEKDVCRQKADNNPQNATILPIVRV